LQPNLKIKNNSPKGVESVNLNGDKEKENQLNFLSNEIIKEDLEYEEDKSHKQASNYAKKRLNGERSKRSNYTSMHYKSDPETGTIKYLIPSATLTTFIDLSSRT